MSRLGWKIKPALFDVLSGNTNNSLEEEIKRIMTSRHLSNELDGLVSDFGIPTFTTTLPEYKDQVERAIATCLMRFEPRLEKTTVLVEEMKDGKIKVVLDLYPNTSLAPMRMHMTVNT